MKRIFLITILALSTSLAFSQLDSTSMPSTEKITITPYVSAGLSMTNSTDFSANSYASIEGGIMLRNLSIGGVFGVSNLNSFNQGIDGYWYEGKVAYGFPLGYVDGYGVFGIGTYIGTKGSLFIEYGFGISKMFGRFAPFIQASNWDKVNYISTGTSFSF